tara:strand:- start:1230 stop:1664 length:435 start_codon:yes stop_codon:yes gene_type:complete
MKPLRKNKENYTFFKSYETRWRDNDVYGHLNNVVYYEFADSIINHWLTISGALNVPNDDIIGLAVRTQCDYFSELGFPSKISCGLSVEKVGNTSVTYGVGLFNADEFDCAAQVLFVHVYVDAIQRKPVLLPKTLVTVLATIAKT